MIPRSRRLAMALGGALAATLLSTSLHTGWTQVETDFPNYYTGAVAVRKHLPLQKFYDWTWFQRQMNYAGTELQLGAYTPQSPLALLPFLPLSSLPPQQAKRVWLIVNAALLVGTIGLIVNITSLSSAWVIALFLAGYGSLNSNFVLGQYYVFLTFLFSLSAWCYFNRREGPSGVLMGVMFALKIYAGPFALFFLVARRWRAAAALAGTTAALAILSVAMFGWDGNWHYVESVMPNLTSGMLIDPYNVGQGSLVVFLRRLFVTEPELNPHPMVDWPAAFIFLQATLNLGVVITAVMVLRQAKSITRRLFAWLIVTLLLLAPVNATYDFTLMALPAGLLMTECATVGRVLLLGELAVLGAPLNHGALIFFPRAWILVVLFLWAGWPYLRGLNLRTYLPAFSFVLLAALWLTFQSPPLQPFERLVQPGYSIAAMSPALSSNDLIYQGFGDGRYVLHAPSRTYAFDGHTLHPAASLHGGEVIFELVSRGHSSLMSLNLQSGAATQVVRPELNPQEPALSPDGKRTAFMSNGKLWLREGPAVTTLGVFGSDPSFSPDGSEVLFAGDEGIFSIGVGAGGVVKKLMSGRELGHPVMSPDGSKILFSSAQSGRRQVSWLQVSTGANTRITTANCNSDSAVWEGDSRHLIFTSDCGRGLGLPGLYRAEVAGK